MFWESEHNRRDLGTVPALLAAMMYPAVPSACNWSLLREVFAARHSVGVNGALT